MLVIAENGAVGETDVAASGVWAIAVIEWPQLNADNIEQGLAAGIAVPDRRAVELDAFLDLPGIYEVSRIFDESYGELGGNALRRREIHADHDTPNGRSR